MKVINIDKVVNLPSIKRNLINHSANISNKIDEIKSNRINHHINSLQKFSNLSIDKKNKNHLKIFTPTKKRFSHLSNNFNDTNIFNSFDSSNNNIIRYQYFYPKIVKQNLDMPLFKNKLINSLQNKLRINFLNSKEKKEIYKVSYYNNKKENDNDNNNKLIEEKNNNKKSRKKMVNIIKKLNDKGKNNYCFLSYAYNECDNFPFRKSMEDFHCIKKNLFKNNNNNNNKIIFSYFSIFDGHGGKEVSSFLSQNFHKI